MTSSSLLNVGMKCRHWGAVVSFRHNIGNSSSLTFSSTFSCPWWSFWWEMFVCKHRSEKRGLGKLHITTCDGGPTRRAIFTSVNSAQVLNSLLRATFTTVKKYIKLCAILEKCHDEQRSWDPTLIHEARVTDFLWKVMPGRVHIFWGGTMEKRERELKTCRTPEPGEFSWGQLGVFFSSFSRSWKKPQTARCDRGHAPYSHTC